MIGGGFDGCKAGRPLLRAGFTSSSAIWVVLLFVLVVVEVQSSSWWKGVSVLELLACGSGVLHVTDVEVDGGSKRSFFTWWYCDMHSWGSSGCT